MAKWVNVKRVVRAGLLDFWRNGFVSFASVLMMVLTLFVIGLAMFIGVILGSTLEQFRDKADMNVYFTTDASEESILEIKSSLEALPQVETVSYISRDDALAQFRERHANDQLTLQALDELGDNPLGAVLNVKAKDLSEYDAIANFLNGQGTLSDASSSSQIIEKIDYYDDQHRMAIERLGQITDSAKWIGIVIIAILVIFTIAIAFNTLRLAIYSSRDEIQVMRLVGAGKSYIRAPFMVEGILYGLIAALIALVLFYPLTWWMGGATENFFGGINVFSYFITHFPLFFLVIAGSGVLLGAVASFLAVRRYLKV
ncbi:MAG TPA: permease-like cell division protein FtsX [Candidatus Paceibacterota bacterium]|nr:permease-like cell division protein FtsX [Candidatus Paceibacterota bacterium]